MRRWIDCIAVALCALPVMAIAQETKPAETPSAPTQAKESKSKPKISEAQKTEALEKLKEKQTEMKALEDKATGVSKKIGELAATGQIPKSQEAVAAMKSMVEQLEEIQESLQKIQEEIEGIKGWIEGQNEALPIMTNDILDLKRHRWGNYIQFQFRDTNQSGGATDAFSLRRVRLGITQNLDPRTILRASFDVATGTTNNVAQLRDAYVRWDLEPSAEKVGTEVWAGQFPLDLGYELARSSGDRELPERATYNRTMFAGERSRGIQVKHGINPNSHVFVGAFNALTYDDLEQRTIAPGPGNKLAMTGGVRYYNNTMDIGASYFRGERAPVTTTRTANNVTTTFNHPQLTREYLYLDGTFVGLLHPQAFLRFEGMLGKDRVPIAPGANNGVSSVRGKVDLTGYQVQLGFNVSPRNQLNVRYDEFDPDGDIDGNTVKTWGYAWSYFINPNARITLAHEKIEDPSRVSLNQVKYHITTLRAIFRF